MKKKSCEQKWYLYLSVTWSVKALVLSESSIHQGYTFENHQIKFTTSYTKFKQRHEENVLQWFVNWKGSGNV